MKTLKLTRDKSTVVDNEIFDWLNQYNGYNLSKYRNNTSGFKGVSFHKRVKKFHSRIRVNKKLIHLGYFPNAMEAAEAYNEAAIKYHGGFASLNKFVTGDEL